MLCGNCGVDMVAGSAFCPSCGKPAGQFAVGRGWVPPSPASRVTGLQQNVAGLLCYVAGFLTGTFFLLAEPYKRDHFIRFHAYQAIWLSAAWLGFHFAVGIIGGTFGFLVWRSRWLLQALFGSAFLFLWVFLMYKAYHREEFKVPLIGGLAAKHA